MSTWSLTGVAKASDCYKVHQPLGRPGRTSSAHTTVGVPSTSQAPGIA